MPRSRKYKAVSVVTYNPISSNIELIGIAGLATLTALCFWRIGDYFAKEQEMGSEMAKWTVKWPLAVVGIGVGLQTTILLRAVLLACKNQCFTEEYQPLPPVQRIEVRAKNKYQSMIEKAVTGIFWLLMSIIVGVFVQVPYYLGILSFGQKWEFESEPVSIFLIIGCTFLQICGAYIHLNRGAQHTPIGMRSPCENLNSLFFDLSGRNGLAEIAERSPEEESAQMNIPYICRNGNLA